MERVNPRRVAALLSWTLALLPVGCMAAPACLAFAQPPSTALRRAAAAGDAAAEARLGAIEADGVAVPRNEAMALGLLTQAARQGDAAAEYRLGRIYAHDATVLVVLHPLMLNRFLVLPESPGDRRARYWYRRAARQGEAPAMQALASLDNNASLAVYNDLMGRSRQWATATEARSLVWLAQAARAGFGPAGDDLVRHADTFPMFQLGLLRKGTPPDTVRFAQATGMVDAAAAQGFGLVELSEVHPWFADPAARSHSAMAAANWERLFVAMPAAWAARGLDAWNPRRQGVLRDPGVAQATVLRLAIAGRPEALADLGLEVQRSDSAWARALFLRAAARGDPAAAFELAGIESPRMPPPMMLRVPARPDWRASMHWWAQSAREGSALAQLAIANHVLRETDPGARSLQQAYTWALVAAARFPRYGGLRHRAIDDLAVLVPRLGAAQRVAGYAQAARWITRHGCGHASTHVPRAARAGHGVASTSRPVAMVRRLSGR